MSQSTRDVKVGQTRLELKLNSGSTLAQGLSTPIIVSSLDQINLCRPSQSWIILGSKVPSGNSVPPSAATNGPFHTLDNLYGSPMDMDLDRWTAPVSVCHACGSALK
jgi:hypothetical protein